MNEYHILVITSRCFGWVMDLSEEICFSVFCLIECGGSSLLVCSETLIPAYTKLYDATPRKVASLSGCHNLRAHFVGLTTISRHWITFLRRWMTNTMN